MKSLQCTTLFFYMCVLQPYIAPPYLVLVLWPQTETSVYLILHFYLWVHPSNPPSSPVPGFVYGDVQLGRSLQLPSFEILEVDVREDEPAKTKYKLWGGADESLAQPTFQCCRMELIVSLERGVCSCAELQVFSCYRAWNEACQATRVISTTWRRELSSFFFPAR